MLKITIIICHKCKKGLDNNAQFKLKVAQFYVLQGKKIKTTLIKSPRSRKKLNIKAEKYRNISKKTLKNTLIIGLKI